MTYNRGIDADNTIETGHPETSPNWIGLVYLRSPGWQILARSIDCHDCHDDAVHYSTFIFIHI